MEAERQRNAAKSQDHVVEQLRAELEAQRARDESHLVPELRAELEAARSWAEYNENELLNELKAELQHERARANNAVRESEAVRAAEKIIKKQAAKKERAAAKKERAAAEKERAAAEKEQAVAEKEQAVAEKERATEKEWATAEKERAAAENERSIAENERAVAANERAVAEKERSVAEKARAVAEEERAILKNERSVLERERATERRCTIGRSWMRDDEGRRGEQTWTGSKSLSHTRFATGTATPLPTSPRRHARNGRMCNGFCINQAARPRPHLGERLMRTGRGARAPALHPAPSASARARRPTVRGTNNSLQFVLCAPQRLAAAEPLAN